MGSLWLAFLLKCVSARGVRRLFIAGIVLYGLYIIGWVVFLWWWSTLPF
jgi:hypothetical protein